MNTAVTIHGIHGKHVNSIDDVRAVVRFFIYMLDLDFHPDNNFADYIDKKDTPMFSEYSSIHGNELIKRLFEVCKVHQVDLYEICEQITPSFTKIFIHVETGMVKSISSNNRFIKYCVFDADFFEIMHENADILSIGTANFIPDGNFESVTNSAIAEKLTEIGF